MLPAHFQPSWGGQYIPTTQGVILGEPPVPGARAIGGYFSADSPATQQQALHNAYSPQFSNFAGDNAFDISNGNGAYGYHTLANFYNPPQAYLPPQQPTPTTTTTIPFQTHQHHPTSTTTTTTTPPSTQHHDAYAFPPNFAHSYPPQHQHHQHHQQQQPPTMQMHAMSLGDSSVVEGGVEGTDHENNDNGSISHSGVDKSGKPKSYADVLGKRDENAPQQQQDHQFPYPPSGPSAQASAFQNGQAAFAPNSNNNNNPGSNPNFNNDAGNLNPAALLALRTRVLNFDPARGRFFVIKSYSEDDVHKCIKYNVWASTDSGNRRLDAAFADAQTKGLNVYLLFSVNASGQFCGLARMVTRVDYNKTFGAWAQNKWRGEFGVEWLLVKDVPNKVLRHISLPNNENKPVTNSRDTQEIPPEQAREVVKIFQQYYSKTSILDDFAFYDGRESEMERKRTDVMARRREVDASAGGMNGQQQSQQQQQQQQQQMSAQLQHVGGNSAALQQQQQLGSLMTQHMMNQGNGGQQHQHHPQQPYLPTMMAQQQQQKQHFLQMQQQAPSQQAALAMHGMIPQHQLQNHQQQKQQQQQQQQQQQPAQFNQAQFPPQQGYPAATSSSSPSQPPAAFMPPQQQQQQQPPFHTPLPRPYPVQHDNSGLPANAHHQHPPPHQHQHQHQHQHHVQNHHQSFQQDSAAQHPNAGAQGTNNNNNSGNGNFARDTPIRVDLSDMITIAIAKKGKKSNNDAKGDGKKSKPSKAKNSEPAKKQPQNSAADASANETSSKTPTTQQ